MAAVGEVLGPAVTPQVAAAWDEVYWLMACELVARESRLYTIAGVAGDGAVWRDWRVVEVTPEATDVVSFTLVPADGRPGTPVHVRHGGAGPDPGLLLLATLGRAASRRLLLGERCRSGRPGSRLTWTRYYRPVG